MTTEPKNSNNYIVGIGASAGGLEAIEAFFSKMPADTGLSFVVIQHLSPDYKSLMVELLSKRTEMDVYRAEEGTLVQPNAIYLIPPKKNLTIFHSRLLLHDHDRSQGINLPIDVFLRSLADDQGEKAVAVILSGTGSDGMRGSRAIKEAGGMIMVQTEESAKFDGMPRATIGTGLADFILAPEEMPEQLLSFTKHPSTTSNKLSGTLLSDEDGLTRIFSLIREKHKVDFTCYKPSTVVRRIERRMTVNQFHDFRDYVRFLTTYPNEVSQLYRELLIGVTSFFRDQEAFSLLEKQYLPELIKSGGNDGIRFWVAGCSTGEEAYSLAMLACECMEQLNIRADLKIFATDIDNDAILKASTGTYPESIAADINPDLIKKYFYRKDNNLHITRPIREMVVFANHNLVKDPPFTNIDLVSCRNLLIYLQPILQKRALEMFNFALNPGAVLFLGSSETTGELTDYFDPLHNKWKLYRSKGKRRAPDLAKTPPFDRKVPPPQSPYQRSYKRLFDSHGEERIQERLLQTLADNYVPLTFVVNEELELLHVVGDSTGFIRVPSGKIQNDISKMVAQELAIPLSTGVQKALKKKEEVKYTNIRMKLIDSTKIISMRITPLAEKRGLEALAVVFIEEKKTAHTKESSEQSITTYDIDKEAQQRISDLEQELQFTRENLQATVEELETSNEELQATNEELLASNEELQSTNEELQSVNEELFTVNAEHQQKIMELTELNNDIENLLESIDLATLFLDEHLCIRKFTPQVKQFFKILDNDLGRPLSHITNTIEHVDIIKLIQHVQHSDTSIEEKICVAGNCWFMMRVVPYRITPEIASGVVVLFVDVTEIHKSMLETAWCNLITQHSEDAIYVVDDKHKILSWSRGASLTYGYNEQDALGMPFDNLLPDNSGEECLHSFSAASDKGKSYSSETIRLTKDGHRVNVWTKASRIPSSTHISNNDMWAVIERNLEERKNYEKELLLAKEIWNITFDTLQDPILVLNNDNEIVKLNQAMTDLLQLSKDQCIGQRCSELFNSLDVPPEFCGHKDLTQQTTIHQTKMNVSLMGGEVEITVAPLRDENGVCGSIHITRKVEQ